MGIRSLQRSPISDHFCSASVAPFHSPCCGSRLTHHSSFQPLKSQYLSKLTVSLTLPSCLTHLLLMPMNIHLSSPIQQPSPGPGFLPSAEYMAGLEHLLINTPSSRAIALPPYAMAKLQTRFLSLPSQFTLLLTHYLQRGSVEPAQNWGCSSPCPTD